jgi:hypothetical protein
MALLSAQLRTGSSVCIDFKILIQGERMYASFSLKMVPVPVQTLGEFIAPNPWTGNPRETWTLKVYALVSETFATSARWRFLDKERKQTEDLATRRARIQNNKLKMGQTIGFESADGRVHMLPRMLLQLWQAREVSDAALPALLKDFEPALKKSDFRMYRPRLIFKVEAILFLVFGFLALTLLAADKTLDTGHRQTQPKQAAWLEQPMHEQTVWVQGQGVQSLGCFRLRPGLVQPPARLNTYGTLGLICGFQAQNETRLALMDVQESELRTMAPKSVIVLRGVVLPPDRLGLSPQLMDALGKRLPQLNKNFIFVYNADWGNPDGFSLGEATPIVAWVGIALMLPFAFYLFFASLWRRRDAELKEKFRSALTYPHSATAFAPATMRA